MLINRRYNDPQFNYKKWKPSDTSVSTTVNIVTIDDPVLERCQEALKAQIYTNWKLKIIRNVSPVCLAVQKIINECDTKYHIKVDEDMVLYPYAIGRMEHIMDCAPDYVGMICFNLYDVDLEEPIQGITIWRTIATKDLEVPNTHTSDMDFLDLVGKNRDYKWVAYPMTVGEHGTFYTPQTIYLRWKSMYEKCLFNWNVLTKHLKKRIEKYRNTGSQLDYYAIMGAAHGIINIPICKDVEAKNLDSYKEIIKIINVFERIINSEDMAAETWIPGRKIKTFENTALDFHKVGWVRNPNV